MCAGPSRDNRPSQTSDAPRSDTSRAASRVVSSQIGSCGCSFLPPADGTHDRTLVGRPGSTEKKYGGVGRGGINGAY